MADLLTTYDDEESNDFIDCKICNKKIRGETNYKVHRTTLQHLKREEALAAKGRIPKPAPLPEWTDIKQYLAYLNLDEPIIGLSALIQVESIVSDDGKVLLKYKCKLCSVEMDMCSMVTHVVGRRHRQKYLADQSELRCQAEQLILLLAEHKSVCDKQHADYKNMDIKENIWRNITERLANDSENLSDFDEVKKTRRNLRDTLRERKLKKAKADREFSECLDKKRSALGVEECKRPELVTWSNNPQTQPGLVARAKAAVVEKQEGWGTPTPLSRSASKNRGANRPPSLLQLRVTPVRSKKEQPSQAEVSYRSYLGDKTRGKSSSYRQDSLYDKSYEDSRNYRDDAPYSKDGRQRGSYGDDPTERSYVGEDSDSGLFPEGESYGRSYFDEAMPRSYDQRQDEYYTERNSSRERYASRDDPDDFYQGSSSGSTLAESGAALHHGEMNYREQIHDQMSTSRQGRGSSMDKMQLRDRNYQYTEKGGDHFQDVRRTAKSGSFEMQGHRQSYFPDEEVPAKKQRKSRFSDASPMDKALAWKSKFDTEILKNKHRIDSIRTQQVFGKEVDSGVTQFTPKMENVLDVLNDIQIESVEEANFLKDKLCTLFKEFQSNKTQRGQQTSQASHSSASFTDYGHMSDPRIDQLRDALQARRVDDQGFQESGRSDRDFRESSFDEERHRYPDVRRNEKGALQESEEYERDLRDFQVARHFEDNRTRGFEEDSREYLSARRLDTESMRSRGSTEARHGDYERASLDSGHHREASRRAGEDRYSEGNYGSQQEYDWDVKRGGTAEQSEEYMTYNQDGERRGYHEDLWSPRSRSEEGMHAETQRHQYRDDYNSGLDLYDPYQPSSPPREKRHSSTLDKLASTLLELVARKTN